MRQKEPIAIMILHILLGCVFIFSGLSKAIDPVANSYQFDDYFLSFHMSFMQIFSMFAAYVMTMAEFVLGVMMICKIKMKLTAWLYLLFMSFFFLLTAWLALAEYLEVNHGYDFGVVKDCGCFGKAIKLSNFHTFLKNVIIIIPTIIVFLWRKRIPDVRMTELGKWVAIAIACFAVLGLQAHCHRHLPVIDFSNWKVGTDLTKDYIGQDLVTETVYIYQDPVTGDTVHVSEKELMDNFQKYESMEYVDEISDTIQPFKQAENYNFTMEDSSHSDLTPTLINPKNPKPVYIVFMQDLDETHLKGLKSDDFKKVQEKCLKDSCYLYGLTNSPREEIEEFVKKNGITFDILCCSYYIPGKGPYFVRDAIHANPGIIRVEQGKVTGKWAWRDFDEILK
ncbi:MAG: DoxX family protein [Bacteroidales bacterium]|nr:DoxX family protein [Bacteroidales bacterium]